MLLPTAEEPLNVASSWYGVEYYSLVKTVKLYNLYLTFWQPYAIQSKPPDELYGITLTEVKSGLGLSDVMQLYILI